MTGFAPDHVVLPDLAAMAAFGRRVAAVLRTGDVVALSGPLGAGKTTLARAILSGAGCCGEVPSPTYTILEAYDPPLVRVPIVHADFYRLNDPADVAELGLADYLEDAVLLAEWPEKAALPTLWNAALGIDLVARGEGRVATLRRGTEWRGRSI